LRCGADYTLLREEFRIEKQKGRQNRNDLEKLNVFIAMGGADHTNLTGKILKVLEAFPAIHANVVTTTANQFLSDLEKYVFSKQNVTLHVNTTQIAKLMNKADFAIITPSVTLNEIFYLDVPFIAIKTAENQYYMYQYLIRENLYILEKFDSILLKKYINFLLAKVKPKQRIFYEQHKQIN
jgi:spore coat polysaccharide biosynthesis predicted glycosyltransferase SpsG